MPAPQEPPWTLPLRQQAFPAGTNYIQAKPFYTLQAVHGAMAGRTITLTSTITNLIGRVLLLAAVRPRDLRS